MENENKLTLWSRAAIAAVKTVFNGTIALIGLVFATLGTWIAAVWIAFIASVVWLRDGFAAWLATTGMLFTVWMLFAGLMWAYLNVDAEFSRTLAGGIVPEDVTQTVAWMYRAFASICGMLALWFARRKMKWYKRTTHTLGVIAGIILLGHAMGLSFKIMTEQYNGAAVITAVGETSGTGILAQIDALNSQNEQIRSDTQGVVAAALVAIENITSDGIDNDADADQYREDIATANKSRDERIAANDATINSLLKDSRTEAVSTTQQEAAASAFNPLFTGISRVFAWEWDPNKMPELDIIFVTGVLSYFLWFGFGEVLLIVLPVLAFAMHLRARDEARAGKGKPIYTEEEMMAKARKVAGGLKAADTVREARNRGPKKIPQAGTKSDVHNAEYWNDAVENMIAFRRDKMPKAAFSFLVEKYGAGRTGPEFSAGLRDAVKREWVEQEQYDTLMQVPAVMNGAAQDDDFTPPTTGAEDADTDTAARNI